jgi:hypothetical protein
MTRREEIINNIGYKMTRAALEYVEKHEFADAMDAFEAGAEWMQETMIEKIRIWVTERYDLDFMGDFKDLLDYIKSL